MDADIKVLTKPHSIISARMSLSPREQDLLALLLIAVKEQYDNLFFNLKDDESVQLKDIPTKYVFSKDKVADIFDVKPNVLEKKEIIEGTNEKQFLLHKACKSLWDKGVEIKTEKGFLLARLISQAEYDGENLTLETTSSMIAEMVDYSSKGMGLIDYKMLFKLNGQYDKRLLDIISRFKNKRDFECTVDELCAMLGTKFENYETWRSFASSVLIKPIKQIIKVSNGIWEVKEGNGYTITKRTKKRGYSGKDIIVFRMRYRQPENKNLLKIVSKDYQQVLDGELNDADKLNDLLVNIEKLNNKKFKTDSHFIKMWGICLTLSRN